MGTYTYTMRAESKQIGDLTIHKAAYAGKPYWGYDREADTAINGPIRRKESLAETTFKKRGYTPTHFVTQFAIGAPVYRNGLSVTSFYDDCMGDEQAFPAVGHLSKSGGSWKIV